MKKWKASSAYWRIDVYAYDDAHVVQTFRFSEYDSGGTQSIGSTTNPAAATMSGSLVYNETSLYRTYIYGVFVDERLTMYDEEPATPVKYHYVVSRTWGTGSLVPGSPQFVVPPRSRGYNAYRNILRGFSNAEEFSNFGGKLKSGLNSAGYDNVKPVFQGSSVTGKSFKMDSRLRLTV